jgi:membrane protein
LELFNRGNEVLAKLHLVWKALKKFNDDHGFFLSSGITFNLLICLVPITLLFLSVAGIYLYSDREVFGYIRSYFENAVPTLDPRIMKNIFRIIRDRKIVGLLGIGGLIWTSTWVFTSLRIALNIVFRADKGRGVLRGKAVDLSMVMLAMILLLMSMSLTSIIAFIQKYGFSFYVDLRPITRFIIKYAIPFFFTYWMFFLIYKIIPNKRVLIKPIFHAALFTSLFWEVAKQLFGWYVFRLGRFSIVYGSLGFLAIFFLWVYYSSAILLLGGEVAYLLEKGGNRIKR